MNTALLLLLIALPTPGFASEKDPAPTSTPVAAKEPERLPFRNSFDAPNSAPIALPLTGAPNGQATILRQADSTIEGLTFPSENIVLHPAQKDGIPVGVAQIRGNFNNTESSLLLDRKNQLKPDKNGFFQFFVPVFLKEETTFFVLEVVDPNGQTRQEKVQLQVKDRDSWKSALEKLIPSSASPKKWSIAPGLGITFLSYEQPRDVAIRQAAITPSVSASYRFASSAWDLGLQAAIHALPLGSSNSSVEFRAFNASLSAGFTPTEGFVGLKSPWSLTFRAGGHYTTSMVSPAILGYSNTYGLLISPVLTRKLANGGHWALHLQFSPIMKGLSFMDLSNSEFEGGFAYRPFGSTGLPLTFGMTYQSLTLNLGDLGRANLSSLTTRAEWAF